MKKQSTLNPKWKIRRSIALISFGFILFLILWGIVMTSYCIITQKDSGALINGSTLLAPAIAMLTGIVGKYFHDVRVSDDSNNNPQSS